MTRARGFSLVEILISVVIFSGVIMSLAGLSLAIARRTTKSTDQAMIMSVLVSRVDRATTIGYDSVPLIAVCDTTNQAAVKIIACVGDSVMTTRMRQIRVVVRTTLPGAKPDTVMFRRGRTRLGIPLR